MFNSQGLQDQFVANILEFKKNGYCVDIGSAHSVESNNSFYFQELGWDCISIELDSKYNSTYSTRKQGIHLNENALEVEYETVFKEQDFPEVIDYLSLDIDSLSLEVLKILPFDKYRFKVITIEHDAYLHGDTYRKPQREILEDKGYELVCSNVLVPSPGHTGYNGEDCPFEDWWIHPDEFDSKLLDKIRSDGEFPADVISKFD